MKRRIYCVADGFLNINDCHAGYVKAGEIHSVTVAGLYNRYDVDGNPQLVFELEEPRTWWQKEFDVLDSQEQDILDMAADLAMAEAKEG